MSDDQLELLSLLGPKSSIVVFYLPMEILLKNIRREMK